MRFTSRLSITDSDPAFSKLTCSAASPAQRRRPTLTGDLAGAAVPIMVFLAFGTTPAQVRGSDPLQFTDVAGKSGLRFRHTFGAKRLENILMTTGSGCALFDYDNDGWLDAFMVNGTFLDREGHLVADKATHHALFHNRGDGTFERVTKAAGFGDPSYGQGCACADFDGDGFTDLYLTNYGPNRFYRNRGDGTFEDITKRTGTGDARWSTGAIFFDYDGDKDLDLFVANYVKFKPNMVNVHSSAISKRMGYISFPGPRDYEADDDILYRNNGDGTFTDVSKQVGLVSGGKGLNAVTCDFDGDGDQDLFVANDATPNHFYRNDGGRFTEIALEAGVAYDPQGVETAAMGVDVADVDRDGRQDLYVTNMVFEFNNLYRNEGDMLFEDTARAMHLDKDNFRHVSWATRFQDFNHDGQLDCFVANGHVVDHVDGFSQSITYRQQNMLFMGDGKGGFDNVADDCGKCFRRKRVSRGAAFGDYDNDGDVDILLLNSGGRAELLRNDLPANKRWLKLQLKGKAPNTDAIGAKVVIRLPGGDLSTEARFPTTYLSSSTPIIHMGLEAGVTEARVDVVWPSGARSTHAVAAGSPTLIKEPGGS